VRGPGDPEGTLNADASRDDTGRIRFDLARHVGSVFKLLGINVAELQGNRPVEGEHHGQEPRPGTSAPPDSAAHAPPDTTHAAKPAKKRSVDPLRGLARILVSVRPISANIQHRVASSYLRIPERPDLEYRLGIGTSAGDSIGEPDTKRSSLSFNVDSGAAHAELRRRRHIAWHDRPVLPRQRKPDACGDVADSQAKWTASEFNRSNRSLPIGEQNTRRRT
jgi:hypothetical protein